MSPDIQAKRRAAIRVADAINKIEGVAVTERAKELSSRWAKGEITGAEMKEALIKAHVQSSP